MLNYKYKVKKGVIIVVNRVSKEDAKRLINDLARVCVEMSEKAYARLYGLGANERPLTVYNVMFAFVTHKGKKRVEIVHSVDVNKKDALASEEYTKKVIEYCYYLVKSRKKGQAIENLYNILNVELNKRTLVDAHGILAKALYFRKLVDHLSSEWSAVEIKGLTNGDLGAIQESVDRRSMGQLKLGVGHKGDVVKVMVVGKERRLADIMIFVTTKDYSSILYIYQQLIASDGVLAIENGSEQVIKVYMQRLTHEQLRNLSKGLDFAVEMLESLDKKYSLLIEDCYNIVETKRA